MKGLGRLLPQRVRTETCPLFPKGINIDVVVASLAVAFKRLVVAAMGERKDC